MNPLSAESRTLRHLRRLPLVAALDDKVWARILPHIFVKQLADGEVLFRSGTSTENLYLVVEGELCLLFNMDEDNNGLELQSRAVGDTAGDFAVINGDLHIVTARSKGRSRLACFPREALELLSNIAPEILAHVYDNASQLSQQVMMARVYCQLFGEIEPTRLKFLLQESQLHHVETGEILFREDDPPDGLYVVIAGRLSVDTIDNAGNVVKLAVVHSGDTIGEYALLTDSKRYATVYATRESMVAMLPRQQFEEHIMTEPDLLASVAKIIVKRQLANVRGKVQQAPDTNFVLIPLDERLPVKRLAQHLASAFDKDDNPLVMDNHTFDMMYGKSGVSSTSFVDPFSSSISAWMDDKENHFSHVVYVASTKWDAWTQRCINRADRIVLIVSARDENDDALRPIEKQLEELYKDAHVKPRIELVLAHPSRVDQPENTERWLRYRKIDAFHHIRIGDRRHIQRLRRRITGTARGLVFSGGGARGYAHLGVHRAIEEAGLDIDYIGGASMGGLLGAAISMGKSYQDVFELSETFANSSALFDYTLPVVSLMKSHKLTHFCREVYGDTRIEDLWVPFFCVSSNLSNGREYIHQRGYLWKAVRTTTSLPGIFAPIPTVTGDLLTDGSVLNTFPVDVMHRVLSGGSILGVDVSQIGEIHQAYSYGSSLSGWQVFFSRINPFKDVVRAPRILETLFRSADIKSFQRINETRELLDTLIVPDVKDYPLLDFKSFPEISDVGYEEAKRVLNESQSYAELMHDRSETSDVPEKADDTSEGANEAQTPPHAAAQDLNNAASDDGTEESKAI